MTVLAKKEKRKIYLQLICLTSEKKGIQCTDLQYLFIANLQLSWMFDSLTVSCVSIITGVDILHREAKSPDEHGCFTSPLTRADTMALTFCSRIRSAASGICWVQISSNDHGLLIFEDSSLFDNSKEASKYTEIIGRDKRGYASWDPGGLLLGETQHALGKCVKLCFVTTITCND